MPANVLVRVFKIDSDAPAGPVAEIDSFLADFRDALGDRLGMAVVSATEQNAPVMGQVGSYDGGGLFPNFGVSEASDVGVFGTDGVGISTASGAAPPGSPLSVEVTLRGSTGSVDIVATPSGFAPEAQQLSEINSALQEGNTIAAGDLGGIGTDLPGVVESGDMIAGDTELLEGASTLEGGELVEAAEAIALL